MRCGPHPQATNVDVLRFHLLSIFVGALLCTVPFFGWIRRSWRPIELALCWVWMLLMLPLALAYRESEPLSLIVMGILIADGAVLPWGLKWQAAVSVAGVVMLALFEFLAPAAARIASIQWISISAAVAIGEAFSWLALHHRCELRTQMLALQESQVRLHGEIAERESALREREKTERELIAAREAALAASRAKSEFLSSMSHEIRTPLNALLGMTDLLAETPLFPEQAHYLETMVNNGNALLELINSILDLARIESGRLSLERHRFDLRDSVEKCVQTLAVRAREKNLKLAIDIAHGVQTNLLGDSLRLRQILVNLIGNAIKFTDRGEVRITAELDADASRPGWVRFNVIDTGIGIAPDQLPTLFSAFTQADSSTTRKYGGSGLGLAIVQRLVTLMNGRVWVESSLGHGSIFRFTAHFDTPGETFVVGSEGAQARSLSMENEMLDRPLRILLADDSVDNRLLVLNYLRNTPYRIDEAENGKTAIEKFCLMHYDLVLMDIQMPEMDGYEATRAIRHWEREHQCPRTAIIAPTAAALQENKGRTREAGCDLHVTKPVKRATLLTAIRDAVLGAPAAELEARSREA
jgi:signal transduction histidine kinase